MLSLVVASRGSLSCAARVSHCESFSCCGADSRCLGLVVGAFSLLARRMWNLPGPGIKPMSPAFSGGFLSTVLAGKSLDEYF